MNVFETLHTVERNGRVFLLHWKNRFDPTLATMAITASGTTAQAMPLMMAASAAGTAAQVAGTLQQGRQAEAIAKQRAAVDLMQADAVEKAAREEAQVRGEKARRLLASQQSAAAASGIRINEGVSLVVAADTRRLAARETGFMLDRAQIEAERFRLEAARERATGKQVKKQSKFNATMSAIQGGANIRMMDYLAGSFSKPGASIPLSSKTTPFNYSRNFYP